MEVIFVVVGIIIVLMLMVFMFSGSSSKTTAAAGSTSCTSTGCTNGNTCGSSGSCMCGTSAACTGSQVCNGGSCQALCTSTSCTNGNTCGSSGSCMCGTSAACTGSQVCNGTSCENSCTPSCTNGNTCGSTGNCECGAAAACTGSDVCYYNKCVTPTSAKACTKPSDCGTGISTTDCVGGVCLQKPPAYGCSPGCADGYTCSSGKCIGIYGDGIPPCATSPSTNACPSGTVCSIPHYKCDNINTTKCSSNIDCASLGSESTCINNMCSCGNEYSGPVDASFYCLSGTQVNATCSGDAAYSGVYSALSGYKCDGYVFVCGGGVCDYGQTCVNNVCT